jgi:hypothetical protein
MISAEPDSRMREMAACAAADSDLATLLISGDRSAIEDAIARNPQFSALYEHTSPGSAIAAWKSQAGESDAG